MPAVVARSVSATPVSGIALLLEDSTLLAMDAEEILLELGFDKVEVRGTVTAALAVVERLGTRIAFALLDVNLGDHTSLPVAEALLRAGVPFAFATSYGKGLDLPPEMAAVAAVVSKPYRRQDIAELVGRMRAGCLLHRHALRQVARLVHVGALQHRHVVGQ